MTKTSPETARMTADVVLFGRHDDQVHVLLIRRRWTPFEGCWALPGGHVDSGEEVLVAAHRELGEETGVRVGLLDFVGVYADVGRDPRGRYVTWAYTTRLPGLACPTAADDAVEARWFLVDEALSTGFHLAFDHDRLIHDALRVAL